MRDFVLHFTDSVVSIQKQLQAGRSRVWYLGFGWGMMFTIHLHPALRLQMSGFIPSFPYSFMV